jgi:hypothetical protein
MSKNKHPKDKLYDAYIIYYKLSNENYRIYDNEIKQFGECAKLPEDRCKFEMLDFEDLEANDKDLLKFKDLFYRWCHQLRFNKIRSIWYSEYYHHNPAVTNTFEKLCNFKDHEPIIRIEYDWFEKCCNAGIQYLKKKDYWKTCYGYDFKNQYGLAMNSEYKIPKKPGKEVILESLPEREHLKPGFYHVKIECYDDDFRKLFAFSKNNVYLDCQLSFAMEHKKTFGIKINLCKLNEVNAYLYDEDDMVSLNLICSKWFDVMVALKKEFPKNRLVKNMFSTTWSRMNQANTFTKTYDEIQKEDLNAGFSDKADYLIIKHTVSKTKDYYKLLDKEKPYKFNIRFKPWITAIARLITANAILECGVDKVVRVHTDGICLKKAFEFSDPNLIPESKTTGNIHWISNNCYYNKTNGHKVSGYDDAVIRLQKAKSN